MDYLYLDAASLRYAYRAGDDTRLLAVFARTAKALGYELAVTDVVQMEVAATGDHHAQSILKWLKQNATEFRTNEGQIERDRLTTRSISRGVGRERGAESLNAGDRSIFERLEQDHAEGRRSAVYSDDGVFYRPRPGDGDPMRPPRMFKACPTGGMLNSAATGWLDGQDPKPILNAEEFEAFRAQLSQLENLQGETAQSHFATPEQLAALQVGKPPLGARLLRHAAKTFVIAGTVMLAVDVLATAAEAATLSNRGDNVGAAKAVTALAGRLGGAIEFAEVGFVVGGPVGAIVGGVLGAAIGEEAVRELWRIVESAAAGSSDPPPEAPDPRLTDDTDRRHGARLRRPRPSRPAA